MILSYTSREVYNFENFNYPVQKYNKDYLSNIDTPYLEYKHEFDSTEAISYCMRADNLKGHVLTPRRLGDLQLQFIFDIVPMIYYSITEGNFEKSLLYPVIISPTFGVSLFDTQATSDGSNQNWFIHMEQLHKYTMDNIPPKLTDISNIYNSYKKYVDKTVMSTIYDPVQLFFSVALMDVYHIYNKAVFHSVDYVDYRPIYSLFCYDNRYLNNYSSMFSIIPIKNDAAFMSKEYYEHMLVNLTDFNTINQFLSQNDMYDVVDLRNVSLQSYNKTCNQVINSYIMYILKILQTSPIIKNREECLKKVIEMNDCMEKQNAAFCFLNFKKGMDCIYILNLLDEERNFTFAHKIFNKTMYSPLPPVVA